MNFNLSFSITLLVVSLFYISFASADTWDPSRCTYSINGKVIFDVSSLQNPKQIYQIADALGSPYTYFYNFCPNLNQTIASCAASDVVRTNNKKKESSHNNNLFFIFVYFYLLTTLSFSTRFVKLV